MHKQKTTKNLTRFIVLFSAIIFVTLLFFIPVIFLRLYISPISFQQSNNLEKTTKFDNAILKLDREKKSISLDIKQIQISSKYSTIYIKNLHLLLPIKKLIKGKLAPDLIKIKEPTLTIDYTKLKKHNDQVNHLTYLNNWNRYFHHSIKEILFDKIKIFYKGLPHLNSSKLDLSIKKEKKIITIKGSIDLKKSSNLSFNTSINLTSETLNLDLQVNKIYLSNLISLFPISNNNYKFLQNIKIPISGQMKMKLNKNGNILDANFDIKNGEGTLYLPNLHSKLYKIKKGELQGYAIKNNIFIKNLTLSSGSSSIIIKGSLSFSPFIFNPKNIKIDFKNTVTKIPIDNLKELWPDKIAPLPRDWITRNISTGIVPEATANIKAIVDLKSKTTNCKLEKINGYIKIQNAKLDYITGLPKAHSINGTSYFDEKTFKVFLTKGELNKLQSNKGTIIISNLDLEDQYININLDIFGPLEDAINIINKKPLNFPKKIGINLNKARGETLINLSLNFPLKQNLLLKEINANVSAKLEKTFIENPTSSKILNYNLKQGSFNLFINNKRLKLTGKSKIENIPINIYLKQNFLNTSPWVKKIEIKSNVQCKLLKSLGFDLTTHLKGTTFANIKYISKKTSSSILDISLDLKQTNLNIQMLGINKPIGEKATAKAIFLLDKGKLSHIKQLDINAGKYLNLVSNGTAKEDGSIKKINISQLKFNHSSIYGNIVKNNGEYSLNLKSPVMDIKPIINTKDYDKFNINIPINISLQIFQALSNKEPLLKNLKVKAKIKESDIFYLDINGNTLTPNKNKFLLQIDKADSISNLLINVDNFGDFLKIFNLKTKIKGGLLNIKGEKDKNIWKGNLTIADFHVIDIPILTKILSLATPFGLFDILTPKGIVFLDFKCGFQLSPQKLTISNGKAFGSSIGLTISGTINRETDIIDFNGTIIPANILNSLFSNIPLVGPLISGGEGEGIFSIGYSIKGSTENHKVLINPLSAFTPGFLRKMFEIK